MTAALVRDVEANLPDPALADADWADAYEIETAKPFASAREAAECTVSAFPLWTMPLLLLRNIIVLPLGLKGADRGFDRDMVGIFPVVVDTPGRFVGGFDDKHLDFRVAVDLAEVGERQRIRLTTVIRRHNLAGRAYLRAVMPFHRAIIRGALAKLAAARP
ncbi:DUF2867 domain-containing protein [Chelativorans salis]|uniref:DUF2867 domain-containing protein n=1 Tax=Chelativorans salis TaxID=2978478 RepID=A0ABT2LT79_9HYPH|nr:DUF2867 domain-containing protein [Chelativorans sp. EGI FJ00035]MCT7377745.1 DUF2867 domain-containing protein [Chelativorans sp. EGI FJ00035]